MKSNKLFLIVLVLIMVLLAACGTTAPASVANPTSEEAQASVSTEAPAATEAHSEMATDTPNEMPTMVATEQPAAQPASTGNFPIGRFVSVHDKAIGLKYNQDGTFEFYFASKDPIFVGTFTVEGDRITTVRPDDTDPKCAGPATYTWSFDGEKLTFSPTFDDPCKGRRDANGDTYVLETTSLPEISIDAADFSYTAPETISEGWVRVKLTNSGQEPHHVQFLRLNNGVTLAQFEEALKQGEGPAMALVQQMGGVGAIAPTLSAQAVLNLPAGEYVILCLIPSPSDHVAHVAKGMIKSLTVQPSQAATALEPKADLSVNMQDFVYDLPDSLPAGPLTIQVINNGPEAHEFNIMRLADGKTADDVLQYLGAPDGPPPFIPVGGMNGLDKGLSGYAELNLTPGTYVAICNIPSPAAEGHPHFTLGMIKQFTVAAAATASFPTGKFISVSDKARAYQFNPDGTFAFFLGGKDPVVTGNFTVVGDLLSVNNPNETDLSCQGSVTYQWSFSDDKLTFTPVGQDSCRARSDSFKDTYTKTS
jgi:uncharacterized cupredoxin-like copper-binding protein